MNTLLEGPSRMEFYTDIALVFRALHDRQKEFNWLITDLECNWYPPEFPPGDPKWLSGVELTRIVQENEIQFIWAVLSGFPPDVQIDPNNLVVYPYAEGNAMFWGENVMVQHPEATVEIVCWDSGSTLLLSKDNDLAMSFRRFFPEAIDLDEYNQRGIKGQA